MRGRSGHAMAARKRRREETCGELETPISRELPVDLLLEIAARSAPHAFIRFAASCKLLRRDILSTSFICRITRQGVVPSILVSCTDHDKRFTLVHPATPVTASFCHDHLFPFFSRRAAGLFDKYRVEMSRRGLILFRRSRPRSNSIIPPDSDRYPDLCVYDPMSGARTFLNYPRVMKSRSIQSSHRYSLLTAADGIDISFLLLVAHFSAWGIELQTTSSCGKWKHVTHVSNGGSLINRNFRHAILHGGIIHWLVSHDKPIVSYDLGRRKLGSVKLPSTNSKVDQLHLATSSDGKILKLLAIEGFMMSVWLHLPISPTGGSDWSLEFVIDMEKKMRSLHPDILFDDPNKLIVFDGSMKRSGDVVLLGYSSSVTVFDLEIKDMYRQKCSSALLEIDLSSRLHNMKIFS